MNQNNIQFVENQQLKEQLIAQNYFIEEQRKKLIEVISDVNGNGEDQSLLKAIGDLRTIVELIRREMQFKNENKENDKGLINELRAQIRQLEESLENQNKSQDQKQQELKKQMQDKIRQLNEQIVQKQIYLNRKGQDMVIEDYCGQIQVLISKLDTLSEDYEQLMEEQKNEFKYNQQILELQLKNNKLKYQQEINDQSNFTKGKISIILVFNILYIIHIHKVNKILYNINTIYIYEFLLDKEIQLLRNRLSEIEPQLRSELDGQLESTKLYYEQQIEQLNQLIQKQAQNINLLEQERDSISATYSDVSRQLFALKDQYYDLNESHSLLSKQVSSLKVAISEKESIISEQESTNAELKQSFQVQLRTLAPKSVEQVHSHYQSQIAQLKKQVFNSQNISVPSFQCSSQATQCQVSTVSAFTQTLKNSGEQSSDSNSLVGELQKEVREMQVRFEIRQQQLLDRHDRELDEKVKELGYKEEIFNNLIDNLKMIISEQNDKISSLEAQISILQVVIGCWSYSSEVTTGAETGAVQGGSQGVPAGDIESGHREEPTAEATGGRAEEIPRGQPDHSGRAECTDPKSEPAAPSGPRGDRGPTRQDRATRPGSEEPRLTGAASESRTQGTGQAARREPVPTAASKREDQVLIHFALSAQALPTGNRELQEDLQHFQERRHGQNQRDRLPSQSVPGANQQCPANVEDASQGESQLHPKTEQEAAQSARPHSGTAAEEGHLLHRER